MTDLAKALRDHLNGLSEAELEELRESFKDKRPKGWLSIEEHLPMWLAKDVAQGYSVYKVKDKDGNEFESCVTDHNTWYYLAKENNVVEWFNE